MSEVLSVQRREFLFNMVRAGFAWATAGAFLQACGTTSDAGTPVHGGNCLANGASSFVGTNHGHSAPSASASDISTGTQKAYNLGAASTDGHVHTVTVSSANFSTLQGNTGVSITTNADATGHTHVITFNCV